MDRGLTLPSAQTKLTPLQRVTTRAAVPGWQDCPCYKLTPQLVLVVPQLLLLQTGATAVSGGMSRSFVRQLRRLTEPSHARDTHPVRAQPLQEAGSPGGPGERHCVLRHLSQPDSGICLGTPRQFVFLNGARTMDTGRRLAGARLCRTSWANLPAHSRRELDRRTTAGSPSLPVPSHPTSRPSHPTSRPIPSHLRLIPSHLRLIPSAVAVHAALSDVITWRTRRPRAEGGGWKAESGG